MAASLYELMKSWAGNPFMSYRFIIEISGVMMASFSQFSGIKVQVQTIQARSGDDPRGVQEYVPVLTSYAPVTLTRGVVFGPDFLDWLAASSADKYSGPSGYPLRRTIDIIALDERGNRGVVWTLYHAMPIGYELSPMDANRSEVLAESVTFAYTAMERDFTYSVTLPDVFNPPKGTHKSVTKKPSTTPKKPHKKVTKVTPVPVTPNKHKKNTRVTPQTTTESTETTTTTTPKPTHKKVTRVARVPVTPNKHKKVTRVTPQATTETTASTETTTPVKPKHKKVTRVTPVPVTPNKHKKVTRVTAVAVTPNSHKKVTRVTPVPVT